MKVLSFLVTAASWTGGEGIGHRIGEHLAYTLGSVLIAAVIAVPLGVLIGHTGRGGAVLTPLSSAGRAVPTLGLLVLVVVLLGPGTVGIVGVLVLLAVPPILTATASGVSGADRDAVRAARALGMTGGQLVTRVEWPLALPLVVSGLRRVTLQVIATATIAAYAGLGGLGRLVLDGIRARDESQVFSAALVLAALAVVLDAVLRLVGHHASRRAHPGRRGPAPMAVSGGSTVRIG